MGYDYATKKPLEDFQLARLAQFDDFAPATSQQTMTTASGPQRPAPLVSSLPVVGILGRQHHVDAIYHDFSNDIVYIFTGMKFYTLLASDFKVSTRMQMAVYRAAATSQASWRTKRRAHH